MVNLVMLRIPSWYRLHPFIFIPSPSHNLDAHPGIPDRRYHDSQRGNPKLPANLGSRGKSSDQPYPPIDVIDFRWWKKKNQ